MIPYANSVARTKKASGDLQARRTATRRATAKNPTKPSIPGNPDTVSVEAGPQVFSAGARPKKWGWNIATIDPRSVKGWSSGS